MGILTYPDYLLGGASRCFVFLELPNVLGSLSGQQILIFQLCLRPGMGQAGNDKVKEEAEGWGFV